MNFKKPIVLSFIAHAVFVCAVVIAAAWLVTANLGNVGGGGTGGVVTVWIAGPEGAGGEPSPKSVLGLPSRKTSLSTDPKSENGGGGGGSGTGDGTGTSGNGDPRLAEIWKKINSSRYYPQFAKRKGIEGVPRVTFTIGEDGSVSAVEVTQSSGEEILDDAAKETVRRSAPLPYYPKPITLAVKYSLKD